MFHKLFKCEHALTCTRSECLDNWLSLQLVVCPINTHTAMMMMTMTSLNCLEQCAVLSCQLVTCNSQIFSSVFFRQQHSCQRDPFPVVRHSQTDGSGWVCRVLRALLWHVSVETADSRYGFLFLWARVAAWYMTSPTDPPLCVFTWATSWSWPIVLIQRV